MNPIRSLLALALIATPSIAAASPRIVQIPIQVEREIAPVPVQVMPVQQQVVYAQPTPVYMPQPSNYAPQWSSYLASQRRTQIERLRAYANAGSFPRNHVQQGMLNIFVDEQGHLCAAANLIALSGRRDLVDQQAQANNFVRLADIRGGALMEWMLTSGLTQEEIARIQEPYSFVNEPPTAYVQPFDYERQRLQAHFQTVISELEGNFSNGVAIATQRLGARLYAMPTTQPYVQPYVQPYIQPRPVYVQPVEYVRRPVRVQPMYTQVAQPVYVQPVQQPVYVQQPTQPIQVQVHLVVRQPPQTI